jgi:hypothetical protein
MLIHELYFADYLCFLQSFSLVRFFVVIRIPPSMFIIHMAINVKLGELQATFPTPMHLAFWHRALHVIAAKRFLRGHFAAWTGFCNSTKLPAQSFRSLDLVQCSAALSLICSFS